jgi:hypothetical protein
MTVTEIVGWGVLYYAFPTVLRPLTHDTGWSPGKHSQCFLHSDVGLGCGVGSGVQLPVGVGDRVRAEFVRHATVAVDIVAHE